MKRALLLQLPVPTFHWPWLDPNIPLAAGYLASWAREHAPDWQVEVLPGETVDTLGDAALIRAILDADPGLVGFSLSVWNVERSLALASRLAEAGVAIALGGPEVSGDSPWIAAAGHCFRVTGEGEETFSGILRGEVGVAAPVEGTPTDLGRLESPYLNGILPPHPSGSIWLETVRGCPFRCAYCDYGKRHREIRAFPRSWLTDHLRWARHVGVREVYLMDPSFNVRPDWEPVLSLLAEENPGGRLSLHTELVADRLRAGDAARLAEAGLRSCEVGLQSAHPDVLAAVGRPWQREAWIRGVGELIGAGVAVTVGLMLGLPGDTYARFLETLEFVGTAVPGADLQVFPLALLPGTPLRQTASDLGLSAQAEPPYAIVSTPGFSPEELTAACEAAEAATGTEIDPLPPPRLSGSWDQGPGPYLSGLRLALERGPGNGWVETVVRRASRNFTLWASGWSDAFPNLFQRLARELRHGVLTLVLEDEAGWPPSRLDALAGEGGHYLDRHLAHLHGGATLVPRLVALVEYGSPGAPPRWVERIRRSADILWRLRTSHAWEALAAELAERGEDVFVSGSVDLRALPGLARSLGPDKSGLVFEETPAQERWETLIGAEGLRVCEHRMALP